MDSRSEASERFLNERREYWRQIVKREGKAPRLEVKNVEAKEAKAEVV